jgi:hypothetical protein
LWRSPAIVVVIILSGLWQVKHMNAEQAGAEALCRPIVKSPWQSVRLKLSKACHNLLKFQSALSGSANRMKAMNDGPSPLSDGR